MSIVQEPIALPSRPTSPRPTPQQRRETMTRSEQLLRDMLNKDGVARQRSLSRSSSSVHPPLPIGTGTSSRHGRNESISDVASSRDDSEFDRPIFALGVGGLGAPSSVVYRPRPIPRNTHDGVIPSSHPYNPSDSTDFKSPPVPSRHASSPLISTVKHQHQHEDFEESFSPSPTSMNSSGWNSPNMHHQNRTPSPSSSNPHSPTATSHGGAFNLDVASEYCKQQRGYISFGDVEGLGRPFGEEEEERLERERIEAQERKKKWWPASWLETGSKTPAQED